MVSDKYKKLIAIHLYNFIWLCFNFNLLTFVQTPCHVKKYINRRYAIEKICSQNTIENGFSKSHLCLFQSDFN